MKKRRITIYVHSEGAVENKGGICGGVNLTEVCAKREPASFIVSGTRTFTLRGSQPRS